MWSAGVESGGKWGTVQDAGTGSQIAPMDPSGGGNVAMLFVGTYTPRLDDKGRLTIPAKYREVLSGGVMVTRGQDHSLSVYLKEDFAELVARVRRATNANPRLRAYQRSLAANTDELRLDAQGRIVLSAEHRRYANLAKDLVVIGNVDHLEIWNAEAWAAYQDEYEEDYSQAGEDIFAEIL